MPSTSWIQGLKVADLKDELKRRGQSVSGKKSELIERLEAYINENEASERAAQTEPAEPASAADLEQHAEKPGPADDTRVAAEEEAGVDVDYGESDEEEAPPVLTLEADSLPQPLPKTSSEALDEMQPVEEIKDQIAEELKQEREPTEHEHVVARKRSAEKEPEGQTLTIKTIEKRPEKIARVEDAGNGGDEGGKEAIPPAAPAAITPGTSGSRALLVEGFVRPFSDMAARSLMNESGNVLAMWMPSIKNLAYVVFSTKAEASAAKDALSGLKWPKSSPKLLSARFVSLQKAEIMIGEGSGNKDFKIARTDEDVPDAELEAPVAITVKRLPEGQHAVQHQDTHPGDPNRPQVKDLRELLTRKSTGGGGPTITVTVRREGEGRIAKIPSFMGQREGAQGSRMPVQVAETFKKTAALPVIYWTHVSDEVVEQKNKARAAARAGVPSTAPTGIEKA